MSRAPLPAAQAAQPTQQAQPTEQAQPTQAPEAPATTDAPAPAQAGIIMSPTGNYYRAGEFCPDADAGKSTVDAHGTTIYCGLVSGRNHWHY